MSHYYNEKAFQSNSTGPAPDSRAKSENPFFNKESPKANPNIKLSLKSVSRKVLAQLTWEDSQEAWKYFDKYERKLVEWTSNHHYWTRFSSQPISARELLGGQQREGFSRDYEEAQGKARESDWEPQQREYASTPMPVALRKLLENSRLGALK